VSIATYEHESAHALIAHICGFEILEVWAEDSGGECVDAGPACLFAQGLDHRQVGIREALVSVAPAALGHELSKGDMHCFARALWLAQLPQRDGLVKRTLIEFARELLTKPTNRVAIAALTDALRRRKYLSGAEVAELIEDTIRRGFII